MDIFGAVLVIGFSIGVALWMLGRVKKIWYQYKIYQMMQGEGEDEESEFMNQMKSQLEQQGDSEETESKTEGMYQ